MSDVKNCKINWKEEGTIGKGGQSRTIKAISKKDSTLSVLKILRQQNDPQRRSRMYRETAILKSLSHSNLIKVIDSNTEYYEDLKYELFIATEYVPGPTLGEFNLSSLDLYEKIQLISKITEVIEYCHKEDVIHRDIKPDNIMIRNNLYTDPVVIDFGLSFNSNENDDDNLTPDWEHLGNRFLILPEQKIRETAKRDLRSDVSCLVGLFYFILTQEYPTVLLDEHNQKPHQRLKAKGIIDAFPSHQKDIINNIFDIGFNQLVDKRWQTTMSLIDQFDLLKSVQPAELNSVNDLLHFIKATSDKQSYKDEKFINDLISTTWSEFHKARSKIEKDLGKDWEGAAVMFGKQKKDYTLHALSNSNLNIRIGLHTRIYITGNEIVIHSIIESKSSEDSCQELFRQPIQAEKDWGVLELALRRQCFEVITNEIKNGSNV